MITTFSEPFCEGDTPLIEFTILDESGEGYTPEDIRLTLFSPLTGEIIKDNFDVTTSCGPLGVFSLRLLPADTAVISGHTLTGDKVQLRAALIRWTFGDDVKSSREYRFGVIDHTVVTT